ncbi:hypothetical protein C8R46DRAFT_1004965 [Mycena filopes]|nr:hypothetical protein C8R46DRAFT_1004965 [Mycena filopes]
MSSNSEPQRVPDLWFPTADLILRAENAIFRVFSDILGARSAVFRDMTAFPQPAEPEGEIIDGIAVVRLHDSAAEVAVFLRAIFDSSFFMPPPSKADFATVIGIVRLAHKYDVVYLFRRALTFLDQMNPHTFQGMIDDTTGKSAECSVDFPRGVDTDLVALRAALEVGALWLLPAAYYYTCSYPATTLFAAGTLWSTLDSSQQQNCLKNQVGLIRATISLHLFLAQSDLPLANCEDSAECTLALSSARAALVSWGATDRDLWPLAEWVFDEMEDSLCARCEAFAQAEYSAAQRAFWTRLPEIFGLPEWEELVEMRRAVMEDTV